MLRGDIRQDAFGQKEEKILEKDWISLFTRHFEPKLALLIFFPKYVSSFVRQFEIEAKSNDSS